MPENARQAAPRTAGAPRRRTIAVVTPDYGHIGGLRAVAEFLRRSIERYSDFEVRMFSLATSWRDPCNLSLSQPKTWRTGARAEPRILDGQAYVHVGARFGEFEFSRYGSNGLLRRLLAECDLVQVVAGAPAWAWPAVGLGKPVALQVATLTAVERRQRLREDKGPLGAWRRAMTAMASRADQTALTKVDAILVENPWMLDHVKRVSAGRALIRYGPPGVNTGLFRPLSPGERDATRPYILAVGRFADPRKNLGLLLDAYARTAMAVGDSPDLVLAGATEAGGEFHRRVEALGLGGRISLVHRPDAEALARLYRNALCLALPSDEEGFGMVVIEAMASGVPVVSTRCGGPDGIIRDGDNGFLVDLADPAAFSDRLVRLIDSPELARAMGAAARRTVEARYAEPVAARIFLDVYETLLAGVPARIGG